MPRVRRQVRSWGKRACVAAWMASSTRSLQRWGAGRGGGLSDPNFSAAHFFRVSGGAWEAGPASPLAIAPARSAGSGEGAGEARSFRAAGGVTSGLGSALSAPPRQGGPRGAARGFMARA